MEKIEVGVEVVVKRVETPDGTIPRQTRPILHIVKTCWYEVEYGIDVLFEGEKSTELVYFKRNEFTVPRKKT